MDLEGNVLSEMVNQPWVDEREVKAEQEAMVEAWLDRLLLKILNAAASQPPATPDPGLQGGLRRTGLDRKNLIEGGLVPEEVDSMYRALYFHSIGMFRVLQSIGFDQEMELKVMAAFKLLTSYLPLLGDDVAMPSCALGPRTKLEMSYLQLSRRYDLDKAGWASEKQALEAQVQDGKVALERKNEEYLGLEARSDLLRKKLEDSRKELEVTRESNSALKEAMVLHEEELKKLQDECPEDIKEMVRLREENQALTSRVKEFERHRRTSAGDLEDAAAAISELKRVNEANRKANEQLSATMRQLDRTKEELDAVKKALEKMENEKYALNVLYHEEATRCAALRLQLLEASDAKDESKIVAETEALQNKVQELLVQKRQTRKGSTEDLRTEIEGLYLEREDRKGCERELKEKICELENQTHAFKLSLMVLDDSMRNIVGGVCLEKQGLRELVESIRENGMKLILMARKHEESNAAQFASEGEKDNSGVSRKSDLMMEQVFQIPENLEIFEESSLKGCQYIEEDVGLQKLMTELKSEAEPDEAQLGFINDQQVDLLPVVRKEPEVGIFQEQCKTASLVRSMEQAYQEIVVSNQTLLTEIESFKANLQSASADVNLLRAQLQDEKRAHAEAVSSLWALGKERMNDMEIHNRRVEDLTKNFMSALEDEKTAHSRTQTYVASLVEEKQQLMESFRHQETIWKHEIDTQLHTHRNQISVIIKELQDTVAIFLTGIESVSKILALEMDENRQDFLLDNIEHSGLKVFPKECGGFWKALEALLEALHCVVREGDGALFEPIKNIKFIAQEKTSELVSGASRVVPSLCRRLEDVTKENHLLQVSLLTLEERVALCGPNMKGLTKQLWSSWYISAQSSKALLDLSTEISKHTSDFWNVLGVDVKQNDGYALRYSKIIRGLEEFKSRLELQMESCLGQEQSLSELYIRITGEQVVEFGLENPFSVLDENNFFRNMAELLHADELIIQEKANLQLEVTRLKSKLKSEQVSRIWRDKYIRDLVNKFNSQFEVSKDSKTVQTTLSMNLITKDTGGDLGENIDWQDGFHRLKHIKLEELNHPLTIETAQEVLRIPGLAPLLDILFSPEFHSSAKTFNMGVPMSQTRLLCLLEQACETLEVDIPNVYVRDSPSLQAFTWCLSGRLPSIIFSSKLLENLSPQELQVLMAQQLYFIKFPNVQQLAMAWTVVSLAPELLSDVHFTHSKQQDTKKRPWFSFATTNRPRHTHSSVPPLIVNSLERWMRFSNLSSDRAALLVTKNLRLTVETSLKLATGSSSLFSQINYDQLTATDHGEIPNLKEALIEEASTEGETSFWECVDTSSTSSISSSKLHNNDLLAAELGRKSQSLLLRAKELSLWAQNVGLLG